MAHRFSQAAIAAVLAAATWFAMAGDARAQGYGAPGWASPEPNYYAMPTGPEGLTAALYPSPRPTPPLVGQTYITYEPLAPHEFLYLHHHCYKTYNGDAPGYADLGHLWAPPDAVAVPSVADQQRPRPAHACHAMAHASVARSSEGVAST